MSNFVHLHVHDQYSLLDGMGNSRDYARKAKDLGMSHLALTNHGNVDGCINFSKHCKENGVTPILGAELYLVEDHAVKEKGDKRSHITLLVKNEKWWQNLQKIITISNIEGFYYKPRVSPVTILDHLDGLIVMSACAASFIHEEWGEAFLKQIYLTHDDVYLEVMPHLFREQLDTNLKAIELSKKHGIKLVATNDAHYANEADSICQEVLLAVQTKKKWKDEDRWKFIGDGYYLKSKIEMARQFREQAVLTNEQYSEALANTMEIAEKCDFELTSKPISLPRLPGVKLLSLPEDDIEILKVKCEDGFITRGCDNPRYRIRYEEEIELIHRQGFEKYFLIVWELVSWCNEQGIMMSPGRGSASGSLVCYLLGITNVDPLEYDLVFARFIAPGRIDWPDIDLDFQDNRREEIRKHLEDKYGKWNIAGASTYSRMKGRSALRDVARVFDIPIRDVDYAAAIIDTKLDGEEGAETTIADSFLKFEDGIAFQKKFPQVSEIAMSLEGQIRGKSQHAAAVIVADEDLRNGTRCNFQLGKDKEPVINWDKNDLEYMGLMKLDILGLKMLTVLDNTRERVKKNHGIHIDFNSIRFDDSNVLSGFNNGNTIGCFQFGSHGIREFCKRIGVDNFRTVVNINALYRPGTLRSGEAESFIRRKKGEDQIPSQHFVIDDITKDTYGIILYQEQVMELVHRFAGLDWGVADQVRKVIAKSKGEEAMRKFEDQFVQGCAKTHEYPDSLAHALWQTLLSCGGYLFNLSHATTYSMLSYWGMYCKIYHSAEYFCALLTHGVADSDPGDKKDAYIEEAFRLGMDVRPPKVGVSDAYEWTERNGVLYMPFIDIKGIGPKTAERFKHIHVSDGGFYSKEDKKPNQKFMKILVDIKADVDEPITDDEADRIKDYLSVSLIKDPVAKYKNLKTLLSKHIDFDTDDEGYWFGYVTELNLGIKKGGIASAYGMMKSEGEEYKIAFDETLYRDKKNYIEHCENQILIVYAVNKRGGLYIKQAWFQPEIFSYNLMGLGVPQSEHRSFANHEVAGCDACELRQECTEPVLPSRGKTNVMIIGEAPGRDEDEQGKGFVGVSGQNLWDELALHGLTRREFHTTNVVKCWPSKSKTPTRKHINKCRHWLDEEFKALNPTIVLAFGNTAVKFFTENDSGIMGLSGTTTWSERYGCWVCWCIHPASMLYSPENRELFEAGVKNFYEKAFIPF